MHAFYLHITSHYYIATNQTHLVLVFEMQLMQTNIIITVSSQPNPIKLCISQYTDQILMKPLQMWKSIALGEMKSVFELFWKTFSFLASKPLDIST